MAASSGRRGRPWRRVRAAVLAQSTVCHLCGHSGSGEAEHDPPRSVLIGMGLDPEDPQYLRPAHGWKSQCWTCDPDRGKACNQVKGDRPTMPKRVTSRRW